MTPGPATEFERLSPELAARVDSQCDRFEEAWRATREGSAIPSISSFLEGWIGAERAVLARELAAIDRAYQQRFQLTLGLADERSRGATLHSGEADPNGYPPWRGPDVPGLELKELLGAGGMGVVYRARQASLDRDVAVKFMREAQFEGSRPRERFLREARAVARLEHPNLVRLYEFGEIAGTGGCSPQPYLVLEYVAGGNLASLLRGLPQAPADAARIVGILASAIHYAHEQGVIHRDLKPANVLMAPVTAETETLYAAEYSASIHPASGLPAAIPKITDFGLAKIETGADLTHTQDLLGTPSYMAPEMLEGKLAAVTRAADVYGLGAILYEALTGRPPFRAATAAATIAQVQNDEPIPPRQLQPTVPRDLETICLRCLGKAPGRRYATARALADDLRRFLEGRPIEARPTSLPERTGKWIKRRPAIAALLMTMALLTSAGLTVIVWQWRQTAEALAETRLAHESTRAHLYLNLIARARHELQANRLSRSERLLAEIPAPLRGWEWRYLKRQCQSSLFNMRSNGSSVLAVAYSPDGSWLVSGSGDWYTGGGGELVVWDPNAGKRLRVLGTDKGTVYGVAFHPDSRRVACAALGGRVQIWDAKTGELLHELKGHKTTSDCVAFSPDGRFVAAGCRLPEAKVIVWEVESGKVVHTLKGHNGPVWGVAYSPDGRWIASCDYTGTAHLWDAATGEVSRSFSSSGDYRAVAFSPDGVWLGLATYTGHVLLRDLTKPNAKYIDHHPNAGPLLSLRFTPDGSPAWSSRNGDIRIMEPLSGRDRCVIRGHEGWAYAVSVSPDGRRIASGGTDGAVRISDATWHEPSPWYATDGAELPGLMFDASDRLLALGGHAGQTVVWDVSAEKRILEVKGGSPVSAVAGSADGKLWAWVSGGVLHVRRLGATADLWSRNMGNTKVTGLAFTADGKRLAWGAEGGVVRVVDAVKGTLVKELHTGGNAVSGVAFRRDGRVLAAVGLDGKYILLSLDDGSILKSFGEPGEGVDPALDPLPESSRWITPAATRLSFSPDGRRLAAANGSRPLEIWDVDSGRVAMILDSESEGASSAAWSADGERLATAHGKRVRIWDAGPPQKGSQSESDADAVARHREELFLAENRWDWFAAWYHVSRLIEKEPKVAEYYRVRGEMQALRAEAGHAAWSDALPDLAEFSKLEPSGIQGTYLEAVASLAANDTERFRKIREKLLDRFEKTNDPALANSVAWTCSLGDIPLRDASRVVKIARRAVEGAPQNTDYADTLVLALYRAGENAEALRLQNALRESSRLTQPLIDLYQSYYRSLIQQQMGDVDEARRWFERAKRAHESISIDQPAPGSSTRTSWSDRVELSLLREEASRALATSASATRKP